MESVRVRAIFNKNAPNIYAFSVPYIYIHIYIVLCTMSIACERSLHLLLLLSLLTLSAVIKCSFPPSDKCSVVSHHALSDLLCRLTASLLNQVYLMIVDAMLVTAVACIAFVRRLHSLRATDCVAVCQVSNAPLRELYLRKLCLYDVCLSSRMIVALWNALTSA